MLPILLQYFLLICWHISLDDILVWCSLLDHVPTGQVTCSKRRGKNNSDKIRVRPPCRQPPALNNMHPSCRQSPAQNNMHPSCRQSPALNNRQLQIFKEMHSLPNSTYSTLLYIYCGLGVGQVEGKPHHHPWHCKFANRAQSKHHKTRNPLKMSNADEVDQNDNTASQHFTIYF